MSFHNIDNVGGSQGVQGIPGVGGLTYRYTTASLTDVVSLNYVIANTNGGSFNLTLPLSPTNGDTITVVDYDGSFATNNVKLIRNGESIGGFAMDYILDVDKVFVDLVYGPDGWKVFDFTTGALSTGGGGGLQSRKDGQEALLTGISGAVNLDFTGTYDNVALEVSGDATFTLVDTVRGGRYQVTVTESGGPHTLAWVGTAGSPPSSILASEKLILEFVHDEIDWEYKG